jgi:cytochrome bd-type quinol oxidase subunit 2
VRKRRVWPLFLISLPAAVAVWSGWVGLGGMCGFGIIHPLPGIADAFQLNTAITLPVGVEAYGGYALGVWADAATPERVRQFAFRSALGALLLGLLGQVVFHLLSAAGYVRAPWPVVVFVSCIPVAALGFGMGLHQLLTHARAETSGELAEPVSPVVLLDQLRAGTALAPSVRRDVTAAQAASQPARPRLVLAPGKRTDKVARARKLRALHPDMTQADIAKQLDVTDRTVRRWLNDQEPAAALTAASGQENSGS